MSDSKHSSYSSFCSEHLMYFVNEYHREDYIKDSELPEVLGRFHSNCIYGPLVELSDHVELPVFAHYVERMISSYNWYITNRYWGFQLLYPVVSFLRVYYSIILTNIDPVFFGDILSTYLNSLDEEVI